RGHYRPRHGSTDSPGPAAWRPDPLRDGVLSSSSHRLVRRTPRGVLPRIPGYFLGLFLPVHAAERLGAVREPDAVPGGGNWDRGGRWGDANRAARDHSNATDRAGVAGAIRGAPPDRAELFRDGGLHLEHPAGL